MDRKEIGKKVIEWICRIFIIALFSMALGSIYMGRVDLAKQMIWDISCIGGAILIAVIVAKHIKRQGGWATDIVIAFFVSLFVLRIAVVLSDIFYSVIETTQSLMAPENAMLIFGLSLFVVILFALAMDSLYQRHKVRSQQSSQPR